MAAIPGRSLASFTDILNDVFTLLDPAAHSSNDNAAYESRHALAMSARTCRAFSAPALRALWRYLPDDQPLADLLCTLGIATRGHEQEPDTLERQPKPRRYRLPTRKTRGYPDFAAIAAYEILRSDWSSDVCSSDLGISDFQCWQPITLEFALAFQLLGFQLVSSGCNPEYTKKVSERLVVGQVSPEHLQS